MSLDPGVLTSPAANSGTVAVEQCKKEEMRLEKKGAKRKELWADDEMTRNGVYLTINGQRHGVHKASNGQKQPCPLLTSGG